MKIPTQQDNGHNQPNQDCQKRQTQLSQIRPVHIIVDDRKTFEERVVDSIRQRCIKGGEEHGRVEGSDRAERL